MAPHMKSTIGDDILFEGTKSSVNLEKKSLHKDAPYLSVVQMDDPVMIQAVSADLPVPITADAAPKMSDLRPDVALMEGMWCNCVQLWAGAAFNGDLKEGVTSWADLRDSSNVGRMIIPSLQITEGKWTLLPPRCRDRGNPSPKRNMISTRPSPSLRSSSSTC